MPLQDSGKGAGVALTGRMKLQGKRNESGVLDNADGLDKVRGGATRLRPRNRERVDAACANAETDCKCRLPGCED